MKSFAVLILAAGFSRRMGQFKPLLKIDGETIIDHLISTFIMNKVEVYVVVGYRGQELKSSINNRDVTVIENSNYAHGMFSSVQAGVSSLKSGHKSFFVMPVDIPLVKISTIKLLRNAYKEHPYKIIYPVFNNRRGHPPLIPISLAPIIAEWEQDGNLRAVLNAYEKVSLEVAVNDENILLDINTDKDYQALLKRFHNQ